MFTVLVAIALLVASVAAIYLLLKSMGQDGVEVAAPGSCKSGQCGVRNGKGCDQAGDELAEGDEIKGMATMELPLADNEPPRDRVG